MFTGIIIAVGRVEEIDIHGGDRSLTVATGKLDLSDVAAGDSISINGVCLTVTGLSEGSIRADVSSETLSCTTLGRLQTGDPVNLEQAMRVGERLGGHLVSGHVDGVGTVRSVEKEARSLRYEIENPTGLARYICKKGSICVDGVSLTVNHAGDSCFSINIIPHTMVETIFSSYNEGSKVNLEVDIIARYLERLVKFRDGPNDE